MSNFGTPIHVLQTDFRSGELDPKLRMRVDTQLYNSSARSLQNCLIYNGGAAGRRPGALRLLAMNGRARLVDYTFDEDERYIFAFQNARLDIYDASGTLQHTFTGATDCPWDATTMWELTYKSTANTTFICHTSFRPKVMTRTALDTFAMADFTFDQSNNSDAIFQPYTRFERRTTRIRCSSTSSGTGKSVYSNVALFTADWVGDVIRIYGNEYEITAYVSTTQVTATASKALELRLDPEPLRFRYNEDQIEVTVANHGLEDGDTITLDGIFPEYGVANGNLNTSHNIQYINDNLFEITTGDNANNSADGGGPAVLLRHTEFTTEWDEQAFSDRRGWPGAVEIHENRLWFGGSTELPNGMFASVVGLYYDFDVGDGEDDSSVQFTINEFTRIKHIISAGKLVIFGESGDFVIDQQPGNPITPGNVSVKTQGKYGINNVVPQIFDNSTVFIQRNDHTVREHIYDFSVDGYLSNDIAAASNHLINAPRDLAVLIGSSTRSEQYAMFVNGDGTMACFHSIRQEQLAAWTPWVHGDGLFDSICTIGNRCFVSVNVSGTYYLEEIMFDDDFFLDGAKEMTAAATTSWALGSIYNNATVKVVSNGNYLGEFTADGSGNITLNNAVTDIIAGYDPGVEIIPNPPDKELADGAWTGTRRRTNAQIVHFRETTSASINGNVVIGHEVGADLSIAPPAFNGKKKKFALGYNRDPVNTITQDAPVGFTVLGVITEVSS